MPWVRYPDLFTNLDERQHAERRRTVNSLYAISNIVKQEKHIDKCTDMLVEKFNKCASVGQAIELTTWVQWCDVISFFMAIEQLKLTFDCMSRYTFDVVGELFCSRMFGFMRDAHDYQGYIHAFESFVPISSVASVMPAYMRSLFLMSGTLMPKVLKALNSIKNMEIASETVIAERQSMHDRNGAGQRKDVLENLFIMMREKGEASDFGTTEVKVEVFAGL